MLLGSRLSGGRHCRHCRHGFLLECTLLVRTQTHVLDRSREEGNRSRCDEEGEKIVEE